MTERGVLAALYERNPTITLDVDAWIPDEAITLQNPNWSVEEIADEHRFWCKLWPAGTTTLLRTLVDRTSWPLVLRQESVKKLVDDEGAKPVEDDVIVASAKAFKEAWESAHRNGLQGHRVEWGLRALVDVGWTPPVESEGLLTDAQRKAIASVYRERRPAQTGEDYLAQSDAVDSDDGLTDEERKAMVADFKARHRPTAFSARKFAQWRAGGIELDTDYLGVPTDLDGNERPLSASDQEALMQARMRLEAFGYTVLAPGAAEPITDALGTLTGVLRDIQRVLGG